MATQTAGTYDPNATLTALTAGHRVRIVGPSVLDYGRTGEIVAVHYAESVLPVYRVRFDGEAGSHPFTGDELALAVRPASNKRSRRIETVWSNEGKRRRLVGFDGFLGDEKVINCGASYYEVDQELDRIVFEELVWTADERAECAELEAA